MKREAWGVPVGDSEGGELDLGSAPDTSSAQDGWGEATAWAFGGRGSCLCSVAAVASVASKLRGQQQGLEGQSPLVFLLPWNHESLTLKIKTVAGMFGRRKPSLPMSCRRVL